MQNDQTGTKEFFRNSCKLSPFEMDVLRHHFDEDWYRSHFQGHMDAHGCPDELAFDFYVRFGGRLGHDPNHGFSELDYRAKNLDIQNAITDGDLAFGYIHWLRIGRYERQRPVMDREHATRIRRILGSLDLRYIANEFKEAAKFYVSVADFFVDAAYSLKISPYAEFSEEAYQDINKDVIAKVEAGDYLSGYDHYLSAGMNEGREICSVREFRGNKAKEKQEQEKESYKRNLEANIPGITHPSAFGVIGAIRRFKRDPKLKLDKGNEGRQIVVLVPNYLPEILFGGYMAFFEFLDRTKKATGAQLRLVIVNNAPDGLNDGNILRMRTKAPKSYEIFDEIEHYSFEDELCISPNSLVVSYCAELHYLAGKIAQRLNRLPIYFIQEYEPEFHANNDMRLFVENAFLEPHQAIYNSAKLREFFQAHHRLGTTAKSNQTSVIENHLRQPTEEQIAKIGSRYDPGVRKLIFYGRPERHAERNLFATFVLALQDAVEKDIFAGHEWEFLGIGSLASEETLTLGAGHELRLINKLPKDQYEQMLLTADVGVSFISTPHPGIVHFQMAAFGLVTITNTTNNRSREWIEGHNGNLIATDPSPAGLAAALELAVARSGDVNKRVSNARKMEFISRDKCYSDAVEFLTSRFSDEKRISALAAE